MKNMTFIIKSLIVLNLLGFLCYYTGLNPIYGLHKDFRVWELLSYGFLHNGWFHLLSNMLGLYFFGNDLAEEVGWKKFLLFYLSCIAFSGLVVSFTLEGYCVGASGGIFGLISGYGCRFWDRRIGNIFLPFKLGAKHFMYLIFLVQLMLLLHFKNEGVTTHLGHISGMIFGYIWFCKFDNYI